jgi:hypothetical protein
MCLFLMSIVRGWAPAFLANIGLDLKVGKGLYLLPSATKKKSFKSSGCNVVKLFTPFIY